MRKASWIILLVLAVLMLGLSVVSASVAYRADARDEFGVGGPTIADVAAWNPEVAIAMRARRGTASAYSAAFATLLLFLVLVPYRRGERWAWWAVLGSLLVFCAVALARVPALGTRLGVPPALTILAVAVVALLLDARRLKAGAP
jgi:hypothetical protein